MAPLLQRESDVNESLQNQVSKIKITNNPDQAGCPILIITYMGWFTKGQTVEVLVVDWI